MKPRKIARRITPEYLHNAALYYLERYAASTARVERILTQKIDRSCRDHPDQNRAELLPLIAREIETLTRVELLNDAHLARQFFDGYRARGLPIRMIIQKLRLKGFTENVINPMVQTLDPDTQRQSEQDAALRYVARRKLWPFTRTPIIDRAALAQARQKTWATLARQGYDGDIISWVMSHACAPRE
jgi:regulatory protein